MWCNSNPQVSYEKTNLWKRIVDYLTFENKSIIPEIIEGKGEVNTKNQIQDVIREKLKTKYTYKEILCNDASNREFFNKFVSKSALMTEYFLSLKDFPISKETFFIGSHFNDLRYLKFLCEFAEVPFEDLLWKESKQEEEPKPTEPKTITDKFFAAYKNQLAENTKMLKNYAGTYRLLAIRNPKKPEEKNSIMSKVVHIVQSINNTFEVTENNIEYEPSEGIVLNTGNYITLSMLDYEENGTIKDVMLTLVPVWEKQSKYGENAIFFHSAELAVDFEETPTFRYIILQKISENYFTT